MTPIEKNVRVVDEQGNEYEATYPKRAKGLVKNGRARFLDESTICLACPSDTVMEDIIMKNTKETGAEVIVNVTTDEVTAVQQQAQAAAEEAVAYEEAFEAAYEDAFEAAYEEAFEAAYQKASEARPSNGVPEKKAAYTIEYALEQLEKVREDSARFAQEMQERINAICERSENASSFNTQCCIDVLGGLLEEQGALYNKLMDFYTGMISDLKRDTAKAPSVDPEKYLEFITNCTGQVGELPDFKEFWLLINQ